MVRGLAYGMDEAPRRAVLLLAPDQGNESLREAVHRPAYAKTETDHYSEPSMSNSPQQAPGPLWRPMETAPKDGTMLRLLVDFEENSTEDGAQPHPTIGANNFGNDEIDEWKFAGWDWQQDCFTHGVGLPVGWLPLVESVQQAPGPILSDERIDQLKDKAVIEWAESGSDFETAHRYIARAIEAELAALALVAAPDQPALLGYISKKSLEWMKPPLSNYIVAINPKPLDDADQPVYLGAVPGKEPVAPEVTFNAFQAYHNKEWMIAIKHPFGTSWVRMSDPRDVKLAELLAGRAAPVSEVVAAPPDEQTIQKAETSPEPRLCEDGHALIGRSCMLCSYVADEPVDFGLFDSGSAVEGGEVVAATDLAAASALTADEIYELNPYKGSGLPAENWRRGFLGERFIGHRGSPAEAFYREGKKAAAARKSAALPPQATSTSTGEAPRRPLTGCAAARDGDCTHPHCPQLRDNEPKATGRHCPLDTGSEEE